MIRKWRTTLVTLGAAAVGAIAFATPAAAADVTVTPSLAVRGGGAELTFQLPEERPGAYTAKVELLAPEATPIAEIYPLSDNDWAPETRTRELSKPVELIHGTSTTTVVSAITWTRMSDPVADAGKPSVLKVSMGPMPQADRVVFTLVQTYSDGTVVRWGDSPASDGSQPKHPAPAVTLVDQDPARGGDGTGNAGTDNSGTDNSGAGSAGADSAGAAPAASGGSGGGAAGGLLTGGLLVALALGVGVEGWLIVRATRRASPASAGSSSASPA